MTSDDEIPLPAPDQARTRPRPALRKRSHAASTVSARSNSSDGPFFSSDDLEDASAENYASPRRKKQFKRTWWEPESTASSRDYYQARREAKQPKDSGIFMSDNSSNDDGFSLAPSSSPPGKATLLKARFSAFAYDGASDALCEGGDDTAENRAYDVVSRAVDTCLETDADTVDLSSCQLGSVPSGPLLRLQHLIRPPRLNSTPANDDSYHSLAPHIKLYLSSNNLTSYPSAISSLQNLTVLSLRNNQISEIPGSIGRLSNLVELNVAGNGLKWLPFELLVLMRFGQMGNFTARPNPYVEPFQVGDLSDAEAKAKRETLLATVEYEFTEQERLYSLLMPHVPEGSHILGQHMVAMPIFVGRSAVCKLTIDGTPTRGCGFNFSAMPKDDYCVPIIEVSLRDLDKHEAEQKTPSLFELALRACAAAAPLEEVAALLPFDAPEPVTRSLENARRAIESGGQRCSVCGHDYLIPRAEWVEYWFCHRNIGPLVANESPIPFLRRVCSWNCVQPSERITFESRRSEH